MRNIRIILNVGLNLLIAALMLVITFYIVAVVNSKDNKYSIAGIGNISIFAVQGEKLPSNIDNGDMVILYKSPVDALKRDDIITYSGNDNKIMISKVLEVKSGSAVTGSIDGAGVNYAVDDRIIGKYVLKVPFAGYIMEYVNTNIGLAVCVALPAVIVLAYISIVFIDSVHNLSKHKKRIARKRRRRNSRYMEERTLRDKRVVI